MERRQYSPEDNDLWAVVAGHCNALPDEGAGRMPAFAKALRAALDRHGLTPDERLSNQLEHCEAGELHSAAAAVRAVRSGLPKDEVMTLVYLIF